MLRGGVVVQRWQRVQGVQQLRAFFRRTEKKVEDSVGLFSNPTLKTPEGFKQLNKNVREKSQDIVSRIEAGDAGRTTVQLFDDLSNEICCAADLTECVRQLHGDPAFNAAAEESARDFCDLVESFNTYTPLYHKLKASLTEEKERLDEVDKRTLRLFLDDFEQSGVHLPAEERDEFVRLSSEVFDAGARFQWGCDKPVDVSPQDKRRFALDSTRLLAPSVHARSAEKRRWTHGVYMRHDDGQEKELRRLIGARHDLARLTGYDSFAHRAQFNSMLGSYDEARQFCWGVIEMCRPAAERELAVLMDVQRQLEHDAPARIGEWDLPYLGHTYKESFFGRKHMLAAQRFLHLGSLIRGFAHLTERLYGVKFREVAPLPGELWPGTLIKMHVVDENSCQLGTVILDVDSRSSKAVGDCHYTVRCSKKLECGGWQLPIAVLSLSLCDQPMADWNGIPVSFGAAQNLFHELGHAMHSMLGRTRYQHVAGTRCPQDLAEIPSNLMEYFFNDLGVFRRLLRTEAGEEMPIESAAALIAARSAFRSLDLVQQATYSLFDLELHGPEHAPALKEGRVSSTDLFHRISSEALPHLDRDQESAFQHRFHHLVQYGAKYYSYLVARSAASLVWTQHFENDPFNREAGRKWAEVQSHGGGLPSAELLSKMLGYKITASHLTEALKQETMNSHLSATNV